MTCSMIYKSNRNYYHLSFIYKSTTNIVHLSSIYDYYRSSFICFYDLASLCTSSYYASLSASLGPVRRSASCFALMSSAPSAKILRDASASSCSSSASASVSQYVSQYSGLSLERDQSGQDARGLFGTMPEKANKKVWTNSRRTYWGSDG